MADQEKMNARAAFKDLLGDLPFSAELYWLLRGQRMRGYGRFNLEKLSTDLPELTAQVQPFAAQTPRGKDVFIFASLHFWIQHVAVTGLALAGLGHRVTLAYLPYGDWRTPLDRFDLRRQDLYARTVLQKASPLLEPLPLLQVRPAHNLPEELEQAVEQVCVYDTQYTLQKEDVTRQEPIYALRLERNRRAAAQALACLRRRRPDVVIIPNGMIQEFGAVYAAARQLGLPTVTYEFGEQEQRIWLGQNRMVMFHLTDDLWARRKGRRLNEAQRAWLEDFIAARQGQHTGEQFAHLWQTASRKGAEQVRAALGLDARPIVLLPTNVMGDSATLGRTLFSSSIAEWVQRVVLFFADRPQVQLVIRIHPAESKSIGPSMLEAIRQVLPQLPENIRLIQPEEKVNTYDLIDLTDLALAFTTTAALEIAVRGIPVAVSGRAHYRGKGFTIDADSWEEYFQKLDAALADLPAARLAPDQLEAAWNYSYAYFREYPRPFPWHIEHLWPGLEQRPLSYVLSDAGRSLYEATFQQMTGESMDWKE
jgi:hypothetical protein